MKLSEDQYLSFSGHGASDHRVSGSQFLGYAFPIESLDQLQEQLLRLKAEHHKARHHCYAYRLGRKSVDEYASDAGEPSGSAGLPILAALKSENLLNAAVIVVRYFGGTKLGIPGLIQAYKTAAQDAILDAEIVVKTECQHIQIQLSHEDLARLLNFAKQESLDVISSQWTGTPQMVLRIPLSEMTIKKEAIVKFLSGKDYYEEPDGFVWKEIQ